MNLSAVSYQSHKVPHLLRQRGVVLRLIHGHGEVGKHGLAAFIANVTEQIRNPLE